MGVLYKLTTSLLQSMVKQKILEMKERTARGISKSPEKREKVVD